MTKRTWRGLATIQYSSEIERVAEIRFHTDDKLVVYGDIGWWSTGYVKLSGRMDDLFNITGLTIPTDRPVRVEFSARVVGAEEVE